MIRIAAAADVHGAEAHRSRLEQAFADIEGKADLVLHGHAHRGRFEGRIGEVPVYNVAVHVTGRDFWIFDLEVAARGRTEVEVE